MPEAPVVESNELRSYTSFDDMSLPDSLLRGVYSFGFEKPSAIQQKGIVPLKEGRDLLDPLLDGEQSH